MKKRMKIVGGLFAICLAAVALVGCDQKPQLELKITNQQIEIPSNGASVSGEGWTLENQDGNMKLTLEEANIKCDMSNKQNPAMEISGDLDIVLAKGSENTISGESNGIVVKEGNVVIRGQGQLTVMAGETGIHFSSISEENSLTLKSGTISIQGDMIGLQMSHLVIEEADVSIYGGFCGAFGGYEGTKYASATLKNGSVSMEGGYMALSCEQTNILGGQVVLNGLDEDSIALSGRQLNLDLQNGSLSLSAGMAAILADQAVTDGMPSITLGEHTAVTTEGAAMTEASYNQQVEVSEGVKLEPHLIQTYVTEGSVSYNEETQLWENAAKELTFGRQ